MRPSPRATWEADFDLYEARIDDARAILALDLNATREAPLESHPWRLQVRVRMQQPRQDGLRSSEEAPALFALEDRIVERLTNGFGAIRVGRVVHGGYSVFVFYLGADDAARCDAELTAAIGSLWPDPYAHQSIMNRRLMLARAEHDDCPEIIREVDHFAYFADEERTREAMRLLANSGFRVDEPHRVEGGDGRPWGLQFHRDERLDRGRPDEFVAEILDVILPLGGDYDGWGALIEQRDA
jgi:hypothetical protein